MDMMWRSDSPAFAEPRDISSPSEMSSAPGVASQGPYEVDLFWVDSNSHLRQAEYNYGWVYSPSSPVDLGEDPAGQIGSPVAVSWGPGRIDVFHFAETRGGPALYHTWFDNGSWGPWEQLFLANNTGLNTDYNIAVSSWGRGAHRYLRNLPNA